MNSHNSGVSSIRNDRSGVLIQLLVLLTVLWIPVAVVGGAVRALTTDAFLALEYGKPGFPPDTYGYTSQQRFDLASTAVHYVLAHLPDDALSLQALDGASIYTPGEVTHMADVRSVFRSVLGLWHLGLGVLLLLAVVLWQHGGSENTASAIRLGGLLTSGLTLGIAVLALLAWKVWFESFHRLFFAPGSWLFSYSDTLIRLFPFEFWFDATLTISGLSLGSGLLLALAGLRWNAGLIRGPQEKGIRI